MSGWTVLAPGGLGLGVIVAGVLVLLHAITVGRPRPAWLPTARFAPDRAPRAARRLARPANWRLLALRALAVLLAGLALARPARGPERRRVGRVVLADVSDVARRAAVGDSVRALAAAGDAVVAFAATPRAAVVLPAGVGRTGAGTGADSAAPRAALDSALAAFGAAAPGAASSSTDSAAPASLSAALVAARRAAPAVAAGADSIELVVVSPFAREASDAATLAVRGTWTGRVRLVRVAATAAGATAAGAVTAVAPARRAARPVVALRGGPADDALAAGLALAGVARDEAAPVRVVRGAPTEQDRAWAGSAGHVLVVWPGGGAGAGSAGAFAAGGRAVVGAFGRTAVDGGGVGGRTPNGAGGAAGRQVVARWADGAPAAVERPTRAGCVREVGVRVPQTGDAALRPAFVAMLPALLGPCGGERDQTPFAPADLARLAGTGPLLAAGPLRAPASERRRDMVGAALLTLAATLLLLELPLRRVWGRASRDGRATAGASGELAAELASAVDARRVPRAEAA